MSAGLSAPPGGRAAAEAIQTMQERGLDLGPHESQPLSERLVRFADAIITMTRSHRDAILQHFPEAEPRVHPISHGAGDVADPIGGPLDLYRRCAEQLDAYLETGPRNYRWTSKPLGRHHFGFVALWFFGFCVPPLGFRFRPQVENLDEQRERHREVDIALLDVRADSFGHQHHADQHQEAQGQHFQRGVLFDEA